MTSTASRPVIWSTSSITMRIGPAPRTASASRGIAEVQIDGPGSVTAAETFGERVPTRSRAAARPRMSVAGS